MFQIEVFKITIRGDISMKKVSQIAEELEVSKQAVYYWIKKLDKEIKEHIYKDGNARVIDDAGVDKIKEQVKGKTEIERPFKVKNNYPAIRRDDKEKEALKERVNDLKKHNELLKKQLEQKDRQIHRLNDRLDKKEDRIEALTGQVQESYKGIIDKIKDFFAGKK